MNRFKTITSWVLVVLGCLMLSTYGMVRWSEQQVLDTDNWVATMSTLPKNQAVADSIGKQLVDRIFEGSDITANLQSVLPPKLEFLAPTISGFLRTKADELAVKLIMSDKFTQLWTEANRNAHEKLVTALRQPANQSGHTKVLPYKINLAKAQDWLQAAAARSDNQALLKTSNTVDRVESFNASLRTGLDQMRYYVHAADAIYMLLPYMVLTSFLAALALARKRSKVLLGIGIGVASLSVLAIAGVNFLRPALLNMMQQQAYKPLFGALWDALLPPFLSFERALVVLALLLIALVLMWRKGVFTKLTPDWLKKNRYFKQARMYLQVARSYIGSSRTYIYGAAAAIATLIVAFRPEQTPQSMLRVVLVTLSFLSLVAIIAPPARRKKSSNT